MGGEALSRDLLLVYGVTMLIEGVEEKMIGRFPFFSLFRFFKPRARAFWSQRKRDGNADETLRPRLFLLCRLVLLFFLD